MQPRYLAQRLKIRTLRAIDAIATHRSLLRASQALGVAQPTLTRTLQEVEDTFGFKIFERHARGVVLTGYGEIVCSAARRILAEIRRLDAELDRALSASTGTISIGTLPVAAAGIMPRVLAAAKERFPDLQIRLVQGRTNELLPQLAAGDVDLVVGRLYEPSVPDAFRREVLYEEPIAIVARAQHPIFESGIVTTAELLRYKLILPTLDQRLGEEIEHLLRDNKLNGAVFMRSSSIGVTRELMHTSDNLTIAPRILVSGDLDRGTMRIVPYDLAYAPRAAGVIYRADIGRNQAAVSMLAIIREHTSVIRN